MLEEVLLALCEQTAMRLRKYNMLAKTVNVQLKNNEFKEYSHQGKLDQIVDSINQKYGKNSITRAGKMNIGKILKLKDE